MGESCGGVTFKVETLGGKVKGFIEVWDWWDWDWSRIIELTLYSWSSPKDKSWPLVECKSASGRITKNKSSTPSGFDTSKGKGGGRKDEGVPIVDKGGSGCTSSKKCEACQGDCDSDSDCIGRLKCFQRENGEQVPGCAKGGPKNYDFCYDPQTIQNKGGSGCTSGKKCEACQGDCDNDSDCKSGLKCFQREKGEQVPGCNEGGPKDYDFCYHPDALWNKGGSGCTVTNQCAACQGDCDNDNQCKGYFKCFQRENGEQVPGCRKGGPKHYDYCYNPYPGKGGGRR